ncbi:MAG: hypothetical protein HY906_08990 [Deltaproteobacteria bacterium]|nr:hypothetical protein [Deltaproteobacteria bacterium]
MSRKRGESGQGPRRVTAASGARRRAPAPAYVPPPPPQATTFLGPTERGFCRRDFIARSSVAALVAAVGGVFLGSGTAAAAPVPPGAPPRPERDPARGEPVLASHCSHASHGSHGSHGSHASHGSHGSHGSW